MHLRQSTLKLGAALLVLSLANGCKASPGSHDSSSNSDSSTSKGKQTGNQGKTFTPDNKGGKGGQGAGASSGGANAPLPSPADTTNGKASAASDAGTVQAIKGQAVLNPGAPTPQSPK